jgi:hypothetical protein
MYKMRLFTSAVLLLFLAACLQVAAQQGAPPASIAGYSTILVKNKSNIALGEKGVWVPVKKLNSDMAPADAFPVLLDENNKQVGCQLVSMGKEGAKDALFFLADLKPGEEKRYTLGWAEKQQLPKRVNIRFRKRTGKQAPLVKLNEDVFYPNMLLPLTGFQPYQTDGPSWENDKVGFRHYFDGRNAKDVFGKRISGLSPDSVGISPKGEVEDNYHVLKDWGRDILPVGSKDGLSVGLGGIGLWYNNGLHRIGVLGTDSIHTVAETHLKIRDNGPVLASFDIGYKNWTPSAGRVYQVQERPTIWPGMYAYQNTVSMQGLQGDEELVIGLPRAATQKQLTELRLGNWVVLYTHDHQTYNKEYILGMAIAVPAGQYLGWGKSPETGSFALSYYARMKAKNNSPLTYYAIACWELADPIFRDEAAFVNYVKNQVAQLDAQVQVKTK